MLVYMTVLIPPLNCLLYISPCHSLSMQCTLDLCCPYLVLLHPICPILSLDFSLPPPSTLCALSLTTAKFQHVFSIYNSIIFIIDLLINQNGCPQGGQEYPPPPQKIIKNFSMLGGGFFLLTRSLSPCGGLFSLYWGAFIWVCPLPPLPNFCGARSGQCPPPLSAVMFIYTCILNFEHPAPPHFAPSFTSLCTTISSNFNNKSRGLLFCVNLMMKFD